MTGKRAVAMGVLGAGLWALSGLWAPAQALTITTTTGSFNQKVSGAKAEADDDVNGGITTDSSLTDNSHSATFARFDATTGVLTRVDISLNSSLEHKLKGGGSNRSPSGSTATATGDGTTNLTLSSTAGGSSPSTLTANTSCTKSGSGTSGCNYDTGNVAAPFNPTLAITTPSSLDSYVGATSYTVSATIPSITAQTTDVFFNDSDATYELSTWAGSFTRTYTYLLHALPSFASGSTLTSLIFDFGTVTQGAGGGQLSSGLSLFNRLNGGGAADQVKLDLDTILGSGSTGTLFTNLTPTLNLINPGSSSGFTAFLDTTTVGTFTAAYTLTLSDENIGAPGTRNSYTPYTLTLKGEVVPFSTPAPPALALLGTALGALWGADSIRRRRNGAKRG